MLPLGHREVPITSGADLDDRGDRQRRPAMSGHHLVLAEVLDMIAEPDDHLPPVQGKGVSPRPLPGAQPAHARGPRPVIVGHEAACGRIGHWHRLPPIQALVNRRLAMIAVPLACH